MTGSPPELRSFLEAEMFYGVKKRERIAYLVAGGGLAIGLMGMIAVVTMLPLKQTEAFLAIVTRTPVSPNALSRLRRPGSNRLKPSAKACSLPMSLTAKPMTSTIMSLAFCAPTLGPKAMPAKAS